MSMIRTQIYLPQETHEGLQKLAKQSKSTLSRLIRQGATEILKKSYGADSPMQKSLKFFANITDSHKIKFTHSAVELVRRERD